MNDKRCHSSLAIAYKSSFSFRNNNSKKTPHSPQPQTNKQNTQQTNATKKPTSKQTKNKTNAKTYLYFMVYS